MHSRGIVRSICGHFPFQTLSERNGNVFGTTKLALVATIPAGCRRWPMSETRLTKALGIATSLKPERLSIIFGEASYKGIPDSFL